MAPLNRLRLLTSAYPAATGDAAFVRNEIDALAARFDEITVYNTPRYSDGPFVEMPANVRYGGSLDAGSLRANMRHLRSPRNACAVWRMLNAERRGGRLEGHVRSEFKVALSAINRRTQLDLSQPNTTVYAFWGAGSGLTLAALGSGASGQRSRRPPNVERVVLRLHSYDLYEHLTARLPLRASVLGSADEILTISEHGREYLENMWPHLIDSSKVQVSRLGTPDPYLRSSGFEPHQSDPDVIRVVSCSAINQVKRIDRIYEALAYLARTESVEWTHLGDGPLRGELEKLIEPARKLTVTLKGWVPSEKVLEHYINEPADVFINLSSREGVPVSVMEALSVDIPVVATNVGGTSEIVGQEYGSGILVSPDAGPAEVANAITRVLEHRVDFRPRKVWQEKCDAAGLSKYAAAWVKGDQP